MTTSSFSQVQHSMVSGIRNSIRQMNSSPQIQHFVREDRFTAEVDRMEHLNYEGSLSQVKVNELQNKLHLAEEDLLSEHYLPDSPDNEILKRRLFFIKTAVILLETLVSYNSIILLVQLGIGFHIGNENLSRIAWFCIALLMAGLVVYAAGNVREFMHRNSPFSEETISFRLARFSHFIFLSILPVIGLVIAEKLKSQMGPVLVFLSIITFIANIIYVSLSTMERRFQVSQLTRDRIKALQTQLDKIRKAQEQLGRSMLKQQQVIYAHAVELARFYGTANPKPVVMMNAELVYFLNWILNQQVLPVSQFQVTVPPIHYERYVSLYQTMKTGTDSDFAGTANPAPARRDPGVSTFDIYNEQNQLPPASPAPYNQDDNNQSELYV